MISLEASNLKREWLTEDNSEPELGYHSSRPDSERYQECCMGADNETKIKHEEEGE
jgi:hypothetical protein